MKNVMNNKVYIYFFFQNSALNFKFQLFKKVYKPI